MLLRRKPRQRRMPRIAPQPQEPRPIRIHQPIPEDRRRRNPRILHPQILLPRHEQHLPPARQLPLRRPPITRQQHIPGHPAIPTRRIHPELPVILKPRLHQPHHQPIRPRRRKPRKPRLNLPQRNPLPNRNILALRQTSRSPQSSSPNPPPAIRRRHLLQRRTAPKCATSTGTDSVSAVVNTRSVNRANGTVVLQNRLNSSAVTYPFVSQNASSIPINAVPCPR